MSLEHVGTRPLETERLLLRGLVQADALAVFRNWTGDAQVARYMPWNPHATVEETGAWLAQVEQTRVQAPLRYAWGIVLKETGEPIGDISVNFEDDDEDHPGEVGYALGRAWQGKGYATEALLGMMGFLRETVGVRVLVGKVCKTNHDSEAVLERAGFRYREDGSYESFDGLRVFDSRVFVWEV